MGLQRVKYDLSSNTHTHIYIFKTGEITACLRLMDIAYEKAKTEMQKREERVGMMSFKREVEGMNEQVEELVSEGRLRTQMMVSIFSNMVYFK